MTTPIRFTLQAIARLATALCDQAEATPRHGAVIVSEAHLHQLRDMANQAEPNARLIAALAAARGEGKTT